MQKEERYKKAKLLSKLACVKKTMFVPGFRLKLAFSSLFLFLLQADSIKISAWQIHQHFQQDGSYPYLASHYGSSEASKQLYESSKNGTWLQLAAKQGDIESAFLWYRQDPQNHQVWLDFAANSGYAKAIIEQLEQKVENKQWQSAQQLLTQRKQQNNINLSELSESFIKTQKLIDLALQPAQEISLDELANKQDSGLVVDYQCRVKIQYLTAKKALVARAAKFESALANSAMADLPICFNQPLVAPELASLCRQDRLGRIECDLQKLASLPQVNNPTEPFSHLLIVVERGDANTRGGVMFMDKEDSSDVFIHELAHWFGLVDEYEIGRLQQQQLCKVDRYGFLGLNLFVTEKGIDKLMAEQLANRPLFEAQTCNGSGYQAYKFHPQPSFMQYLEQPVSDFYLTLIKESLNWSNVVPVAMNFAHIYKDNYEVYLNYIKQAAALGYQGAITEFSQYLVEQGSYLEAKNWLEFGAEQGGANSKLLLGHAYLEGRWLPRDLNESASWYKKAAEQNDGYGLYFYGKCLEMGWGCIQSKEQAFEYYRKSALMGNKLAKRKLNQAL